MHCIEREFIIYYYLLSSCILKLFRYQILKNIQRFDEDSQEYIFKILN